MSIIGWLVLGLIAGFIGSKIVNKTGEGVILDIVLGIVGGVVGGFLFSLLGAQGVTGFNLYSMFRGSHRCDSGAGHISRCDRPQRRLTHSRVAQVN